MKKDRVIRVDEHVYSYILDRKRHNESIGDTLKRLLKKALTD